ncbi:MAG TPA: phage capsid protein [Candidatus Fusicatenibacter intestinigallinarum]|uniref:Phage capsid protein n=1 Tax=Candidatus Fusicatenibacter intestinigallinarum TaxID=2838598 RepID=A0A9D2SP46_9FIRM|nr:phage capsid protein [Candidatus Fusicatenibacter intestinigallinarum]
MFDGFRKFWRGVMRMFGYTTLKNIVGKNITLSDKMIDAINDWKNMLNGQADWLTDYVRSLRIEDGICREFTDAVLIEMESSVSVERLDQVYQKTIANLSENLQEGLGLGSLIIKPIGPDKAEFITADKFIPISFDDNGNPVDIGFLTVKRIGENDYFTRFERHYLLNGSLTIENKCYHSQDQSDIGQLCSLGEVPEWAEINPGPVTYPGMQQMDFGYYRNPIKNRIDGSACGVSVFESARELIRKADIQGARLDWEYESGERAIHVDARALKQDKNTGRFRMAKLNRRLYRGLNIEDGKDKELLKEYSPTMRDDAYNRGLEKYLREIEFNVGLAYGDLSDVQQVEKTAAEIKTSKARKYNRVGAIQLKLKDCLEGFVSGLAFYNGLYTSGYKFMCNFNDSILTDEETERQQDRQDVSMGVMSHLEYRMKWYNEDETTARKNLPEQNTVME